MADIIVLGAGMVGVSTALALQLSGRDVVLVDRKPAGRETSYGNAGLIQAEAVEPHAFPQNLTDIIQIALKKNADVNFHPSALPLHAKALWSYFRNSSPEKYNKISSVYSGLIKRATQDHAAFIEASGSDALIKRNGFKDVFIDEKLFEQGRNNASRLNKKYGVESEFLDGDQLAAVEPALRKKLGGAIVWKDAWSCTDPGKLTEAYANLFTKRGGQFVHGDAQSLQQTDKGWRILTNDGPLDAESVVVALGPWSDLLLNKFGYNFPILRKRGYHRHFSGSAKLNTPMYFCDASMVLASMDRGIRVLTGAEIALRDAPLTPVQLTAAEKQARNLVDLGEPVETQPWAGNRPCMPDMLPVIGRAWNHKGLWMHFGHGHQGFTLGPTTAKILAEAMSDGAPIHPALDPRRFK